MAGPYYPAGTTAANITSFTDSIGLIAGKKYWYKVRAQNNYGVSALINNFEGSWTFNNNYSDESGAANNLAGYGLPKFNTAAAEGTHALQLNGNNQYGSFSGKYLFVPYNWRLGKPNQFCYCWYE